MPAGFWAGLVFRYRGFARWALLGLAAALVGTAFLLINVLAHMGAAILPVVLFVAFFAAGLILAPGS